MDETAFVPMDDKHLEQFGENTARSLHPRGRAGGRRLKRQLDRELRELRKLRDRLTKGTEAVPGAEWLLDNWYLAQREGLAAGEDFRRVKGLRTADREGQPLLVLELARAFLWGAGEEADLRRLEIFLRGAQSAAPLTEQELALLPAALKAALVERILRLGRLAARGTREGERLEGAMAQAFTLLRTLSGMDLSRLLEANSAVDRILRRDPAGVYGEMDEDTRGRYRARVCRLAREWGMSEPDLARQAVEQAAKAAGEDRHVGRQLFPEETRPWGRVYMEGIVLGTAALTLALGLWLRTAWAALLLVLPLSDIVKNCADFLAARLTRPRPVHRMALEGGIPPRGRTLCVIACLLTGEASGAELAGLLEGYRLANRDAGRELALGLLADLPDGRRPMGGAEQKRVELARQAVETLNEKYGGGFYLFFRAPVFHAPDQRYMGWERKRGALVELCRFLRGRPGELEVLAGDKRWLGRVKYVLTLDMDTALTVGSARALAGAMLHPLNRPVVDPERRVVVRGYGLLQPRVTVDLASADRSQFSRIFAGQGGVDPYGTASSDVYHDLFDRGTYTGKGIFDVDVFLTCLDGRLPQNAILSHDLLEGACLRAGLAAEVELTDGCPSRPTAWFARLHRWTRGDWQLLPWLGRRVRNEAGDRVPNPLGPVDRWKIFDNLRRSLSPVLSMAVLILGMGLGTPVFGAAAGIAVLSAASDLLLSGADLALRRGGGFTERYHAAIITGFGRVLLQTLVQLLLLPYHAWVSATAVCTALWRMGVSRRGLLAWTTAAEAEKRMGGGLWACCRAMWPASVLGLGCTLMSKIPLGSAAGLVWFFSPLLAWLLGRPIPAARQVPEAQRPFLLHQAGRIWQYFADFLRPQDHYLPPDNFQEQPPVGLARRTSPTNIGMALLCCAAAADLDLTGRDRAVELLRHMLDTLEGLEKWRGHLYNWYDTASARPMEPRYISTVDSGNLCGCLIALAGAMEEWGEPALARRARALADDMELAALYDPERKLFSIGYDCGKGEFSPGWYDLMASEARQTSYLAVARGEVPPRHWRRLSRALVGQDHYRGMASWTGTMFEYFMPHLLLPVYEDSLLYESLAFCLYTQKKRVRGTGAPWGISESAFYALDSGLNYRYKAHGVQALGLKRGLDRELVVAPYAAFLALLLEPGAAGEDLRRMEKLGLEGRYGLCEAADFTPGRLPAGAKYEPVRTYMAHHLGMSLVAIDNALCGNAMQRRFFADPALRAYRELLQEKVPVGARIMGAPRGEARPRPARPEEGVSRTGTGFDRDRPVCHLLSGGAWRVLCTDAGEVKSEMGQTQLTGCTFRRQFAPCGVSFFLQTQDFLLPLTPAPLYREGPAYSWEFRPEEAKWRAKWGKWETEVCLRVPRRENGEVWEVRVMGRHTGPAELICYLEPVVAQGIEYDAHPAFSKLGLESREVGNGVLFLRRPRGTEEGRPVLAVHWDARDAGFDTDREVVLGRGGLRALERRLKKPAGRTAGAVADPCLLVRFPLERKGSGQFDVRVALAASDSAVWAQKGAKNLLKLGPEGQFLTEVLSREETLQAYDLLRRLQFPAKPPVRRGSKGQKALWPLGISGDYPILVWQAEKGEGAKEVEGAETGALLCRLHRFLRERGFRFDLVLLLDEGGDYRQGLRRSLEETLRELEWSHALGARGGIFLLDREKGDIGPVLAAGQLWGEAPGLPPALRPAGELPPVPEEGIPPFRFEKDGAFVFSCGDRLPPVGWSMVLANENFGWRTDETGGGHLWLGNAKENPLTPWRNDPLAAGGPEELVMRRNGKEISWFAAGDGLPCRVEYRPGRARWEKGQGERAMVCTAFVPPGEAARYLLLEGPAGGEVCYRREGAEEQTWSFSGHLVLVTRPDEAGEAPETREGDWDKGKALEGETLAWWGEKAAPMEFRTPDRELDCYLNGWCLYQVMACRLFARTSLYQNGGAYGFRDQLQDVCALILTAPEQARAQILRACARQYREGDVQHWWHPAGPHGGAKGVRTRISDDLLWLPYALCEYVDKTGDRAILEEAVPFLLPPPLREGERERYEEDGAAGEPAPVLEHARRAVELVLARGAGAHGLAKMGTGDWNDGMDRVGAGGAGESVWLTWFLALVLDRFAALTGEEGWRQEGARWAEAAGAAWDGAWYLRGYYDDGSTLGSRADDQCRIDSVAQSFAALAPGADRERTARAVESALGLLWDREHKIVKLFTPPFEPGGRDTGYIQGYPPGVRENGGQYTHGAVWLALACLRLGRADEGWGILHDLLPAVHDPEVYRGEPFVLAGDVSAAPGREGRAGWTWYTGAAGWYWRTAVEELLGLKVRGEELTLEPRLPEGWPGYSLRWGELEITVERTGTPGMTLDGAPWGGAVPRRGKHRVVFSV